VDFWSVSRSRFDAGWLPHFATKPPGSEGPLAPSLTAGISRGRGVANELYPNVVDDRSVKEGGVPSQT